MGSQFQSAINTGVRSWANPETMASDSLRYGFVTNRLAQDNAKHSWSDCVEQYEIRVRLNADNANSRHIATPYRKPSTYVEHAIQAHESAPQRASMDGLICNILTPS